MEFEVACLVAFSSSFMWGLMGEGKRKKRGVKRGVGDWISDGWMGCNYMRLYGGKNGFVIKSPVSKDGGCGGVRWMDGFFSTICYSCHLCVVHVVYRIEGSVG